MSPAAEVPSPRVVPRWLAGLARGVTGVAWIMGCLGLSSFWRGQTFWTAANLMAAAFYPGRPWRDDFGYSSVAGLAVYVLIYGALGALFAAAVPPRLGSHRLRLAALGLGMAWYFLAYRLIYRLALPLLASAYAETPTLAAHLLFGLWLGGYPRWLEKAPSHIAPAENPLAEAAATQPADSPGKEPQ